jgi:hypothetical protein
MEFMGRTSLEDKKRDFRRIYEEFVRDFRIYKKDIAKVLNVTDYTATRRIKEAVDMGYLLAPQIRRRSFDNFPEYVSFFNCENPTRTFKKLEKDNNVVHHTVMGGFANLMTIATKENIEINGEKVEGGRRTDYHVAYALNCLWNESTQKMWEEAKNFDPKKYKPQNIITSQWGETLDWWGSDFEILFREFKYNGREKYTPILQEHSMSTSKVDQFLKMIDMSCTVYTRFFPNSIRAYDAYYFLFKSKYIDFLINLFSKLPTSPFFYKVGDKLCMNAYVEKSSVRENGLNATDISQIELLYLVDNLVERGIIEKESHAIVEYHCSKAL